MAEGRFQADRAYEAERLRLENELDQHLATDCSIHQSPPPRKAIRKARRAFAPISTENEAQILPSEGRACHISRAGFGVLEAEPVSNETCGKAVPEVLSGLPSSLAAAAEATDHQTTRKKTRRGRRSKTSRSNSEEAPRSVDLTAQRDITEPKAGAQNSDERRGHVDDEKGGLHQGPSGHSIVVDAEDEETEDLGEFSFEEMCARLSAESVSNLHESIERSSTQEEVAALCRTVWKGMQTGIRLQVNAFGLFEVPVGIWQPEDHAKYLKTGAFVWLERKIGTYKEDWVLRDQGAVDVHTGEALDDELGEAAYQFTLHCIRAEGEACVLKQLVPDIDIHRSQLRCDSDGEHIWALMSSDELQQGDALVGLTESRI